MKKILLVGLLVCAILASVVTGTLAVYNVTLDEMSGDVVAKTFVLDQAKQTENFGQIVKIAPTENQVYIFTVTNTKNGAVSETAIDVSIKFALSASTGKNAIGNLTMKIERSTDGTNYEVKQAATNLTSGVGEVTLTDHLAANTSETVYYRVTVEWPSTSSDNDYMGAGFGTKMAVRVSGEQDVA